jgi:D-alanyl-D-alanine carboxypeptidase
VSYVKRIHSPLVRIAAIAVIALTVVALSVGDADARHKRKKRIGHGYRPALSHIVLDVKTGKALESFKADDKRFPASLTKVMTLYLLFERMEAGELKLGSQLKVSSHAASRPPTKLGLKPGSSIRVEDAIKALVTKSANDAAVVVAEAIGGSEREFARMMTSKAHALGMTRTTYTNASGLPDPRQTTTARDQAILGRAIQWHFPKQYRYFATNSFMFHGRRIRTHNRLLGQVKGVDGIKTGYIRASGFNLVTSVRRDRRHIVAVVIGGRTGRSRDAFMRNLIHKYIGAASRVQTARPQARAAAGAIDPDDLPMPPVRPEPPVASSFSIDLAGDTSPVPPAPSDTKAAAPSAKALIAIVSSAASSGNSAFAAAPRHAAALAWRQTPGLSGWFPYLLAALIGCGGLVAAALCTIAPLRRRRLPGAP